MLPDFLQHREVCAGIFPGGYGERKRGSFVNVAVYRDFYVRGWDSSFIMCTEAENKWRFSSVSTITVWRNFCPGMKSEKGVCEKRDAGEKPGGRQERVSSFRRGLRGLSSTNLAEFG